jgi:hypothetical protein
MAIHDWIKTVRLQQPYSLGPNAKKGLTDAGMIPEQLHQTGAWWNDDKKCQESHVWDKESNRIFRLWRGTPQDRWIFGEEVVLQKSA